MGQSRKNLTNHVNEKRNNLLSTAEKKLFALMILIKTLMYVPYIGSTGLIPKIFNFLYHKM